MRVLVSGAGGFIGRHAVRALQARGIEVVAIGRRAPPGLPEHAFLQADLLEPGDLGARIARIAPSHLLHLAWYAEHGKFWDAPVNLRWVEASTRLAEAFCAAGGRRMVVAGTCAEYAWDGSAALDERSVTLAPGSLYGTCKDATRRLLEAICRQNGASLAWARIFFPYGPGEPPRKLVPSLLDALQGRQAPFPVNTGARRDFLHVEDVAAALRVLLEAEDAGTFNLSSGHPTSLHALILAAAAATGADPAPLLALAAQRPHEPAVIGGVPAGLRALGWSPRITLEQGLAALAARPGGAHG